MDVKALTMGRTDTSSLKGLRLLRDAGLLDVPVSTPNGGPSGISSEDEECAKSKRIGLVNHDTIADTLVVDLVDLGGKHLHRGLRCPEAFSYFSTLRSINLAGTDLPLADLETVLVHISKSIQCVFLGGNGLGLGSTGTTLVAKWIVTQQPPKLIKLDLRYNDISAEGMAVLCEGLEQSKISIKYLHMEGNAIGNEGCNYLAKFLQNDSCKLAEVFLGANQIESSGAQYLALALESNATLSKLYLEGNSIGSDGATAFSEALEGLKENNKTLQHLFVDNNAIGKEALQRLGRALNSTKLVPDGV
jgi:Ran GTPase-activating protein (RanGAP) involved in mRNA processing and transport